VDGKILFPTLEGDLFIFGHGRLKNLLGRVTFDEPIQVAPAVAGGLIYVATDGHLYALRARKTPAVGDSCLTRE
jgi:outer membrane protein assembly factor BamB